MSSRNKRIGAALVLAIAAAGFGYLLGAGTASARPGLAPSIPAANIAAPPKGTTRVIYSLDRKQNDKEIIALIENAKTHVYFAMYEFTLKDVADALVAAKQRGLDVRGLVDAGESANSYDAPLIRELVAAGIPVETEKHADGNGIMHIKAIVTDSAYALGSYNWTGSATTENDELLEIGTDPALVATYEGILQKLFAAYAGTNAAAKAAAPISGGTYDYTDAPNHIGEYASVRGTLIDAYTSSSGTVFLDFCKSYKSCPFSAVIFADDAKAFGDLSRLSGQAVTVTGTISSYQGRAEIKLSSPDQLSS
ncbi:MAG TPA: phospholipase D-like domain-containing protein [Candidatus Paceibacterota bacterium]|nr:phospholipase D-like domain-containing protein [Candidatus Paceibacterota bacterium]